MKPYYEHSGVTIYHGDCRDVIPHITADVLVTDPPYGVNLGNSEETRPGLLVKKGYESYVDSPENFDRVVTPAITLALSIVDRGVVFCAGHMVWRLPPAQAIGGIFLPAACGRGPWGWNSFAYALLYGKAPDLHKGAKPTGISSSATADGRGHPCAKPLTWMGWAIQLSSRMGEIIVDPFMGSGTTLRAAKDLGRPAIGIDIEERYCEIAVKRMAQETLF